MSWRANQESIVGSRIVFPYRGAVRGTLLLTKSSIEEGQRFTLDLSGAEISVSALSVRGHDRGTTIDFVGGSAKLRSTIKPLHFRRTSLNNVLQSIASELGLELAALGDIGAQRLDYWSQPRMSAERYLDMLCQSLNFTWQILDNGALYVGAASPSGQEADSAYPWLHSLDDGIEVLAADAAIELRPGWTWRGRAIRSVGLIYGFDGIGSRPSLTIRLADAGDDNLVSRTNRRAYDEVADHRYRGVYGARIVAQSSIGDIDAVDIIPDDPTLAGGGLSEVPVLQGLPGRVKLGSGLRCMFVFLDGDPRKPRVIGYEGISGAGFSFGSKDSESKSLAIADPILEYLSKLQQALSTWVPMPNDGGAALQAKVAALVAPAAAATNSAIKAKTES